MAAPISARPIGCCDLANWAAGVVFRLVRLESVLAKIFTFAEILMTS